MSSKEIDEKTENCTTTQQNPVIDDKLTDLSCPFTWGMKDVIENRKKLLDANESQLEKVVDIRDNFPELALIYHLMLAYENVMICDLPTAMQCIKKAEESLVDIQEKATLLNVENVLQHIFVATKCHVLQKLEQATEVDDLLKGIFDIRDMNKTESAMLYGCQCLAWMLYYATDNLMAIKCAEKAIKYECDNGRWHFLLGKNYRRLRRRHDTIAQKPSPQETVAFEKAFMLSENVLFGVSLAQLYRESRQYSMANKIYKNVYDLQPTCCKVRLQLALGFIRANQCMLAKNCLDYVAEQIPDSSAYTHYMAIYQEKCRHDFKAALPYYKSTTENCNYAAECQYIKCRKKVEQDWDPLPYMLGLLKKYEKDSDHTIQEINIIIGSYYLFEKRDILSACQYLTRAIVISPNAKVLQDHYMLFHQSDRVNIYHALSKEVQFTLQNGASKYDDEEVTVLKDMLQLCHKSCKDLPPPSELCQERISSLRLPSNCRNYERVVSSHTGISVRRERRGSSSRGLFRNHPQRSSDDAKDERDKTSWRSEKLETQGSKNEDFFSNPFKDERDSTATDRVRGSGIRRTASSKPRDKNDDGEADASFCLVKTLEDFKL